MVSDVPDKPENDNIPILEDVVIPDELEVESENLHFEDTEAESFDTTTPEYDKVLLAMRDDIVAQLQADLHPLVVRSIEQAISESLERANRILHKELTRPLEQRLLNLIEERMEEEFGPREHPLDEEDEEE